MPLCHRKRGLREETYSIKEKPISADPTALPYSALPTVFEKRLIPGRKRKLIRALNGPLVPDLSDGFNRLSY